MEVMMSGAELVVAGCLIALGLAHSTLGESGILRPLFAATWTTNEPRWAVERILRFAWHITSVAWFALAAIVLGANLLVAVGVMSLVSAAIIFVMLRGHLAWPLFLLAGLAALRADGVLGDSILRAGAIATTAALGVAALVHVYWALGGTWMLDRALPPTDPGGFSPGPWLTLSVAGALAVFGALVGATAFDAWTPSLGWLVGIGVGVLTLRAIGDTRVAGFTKSVRDTDFAIADDRFFTPIIVFLALGASGAIVV